MYEWFLKNLISFISFIFIGMMYWVNLEKFTIVWKFVVSV